MAVLVTKKYPTMRAGRDCWCKSILMTGIWTISVDASGMMPQGLKKANEIGKYVADEAVAQLLNAIDTSAFPRKPTICSLYTSGTTRSGIVEVEVELSRKTFREGLPSRLYQSCSNSLRFLPNHWFWRKDLTGKISEEEVLFDYELPKTLFGFLLWSVLSMYQVQVDQMPEFSWQTFALIESWQATSIYDRKNRFSRWSCFRKRVCQSNDHFKRQSDRQRKAAGKNWLGFIGFEDVGDIGNGIFSNNLKGTAPFTSSTVFIRWSGPLS